MKLLDIAEVATSEVTRRRFIKRSSGITLSIVLADLVPATALAAEDEKCNTRDSNSGSLNSDGTCGDKTGPGAYDPDQACNQQLSQSDTFLRDPDGNCTNTNGNDASCGLMTSNAPNTYDTDDTCGKIDAGNNKMRDEQCDKSYRTEGDGNAKDQYCGTGTTSPHVDKDEFCRSSPEVDQDQSCGKTTMEMPLLPEPDEAGLGPGRPDNTPG
ncbi:hypothetical protein [Luteolibacter luteus]|uniref:Uncharacterized protein n=1 Tax=Luteolibacter luteus TaxID=2728835 RepID=A0A858RJC2_9BACT|nr:hypothetical protein [Luteolibacter luteus]QJE96942.1 hypothetical protein HHL09_14480 [Luteolibacter luteus]